MGIRERLERVGFAARVAARTGVLGSLSPRGLLRFRRARRGAKPGPHLTLVLHACNSPDRVAVADGARRVTYAALNREVNQLAHGLASLGVGAGDRVGIMMRNCVEFVVAQQASARLGATAVQIGYRLKPREIGYLLQNSQPKAVLSQRDFAAFVVEARELAGQPAPERLVVTGAGAGSLDAGVRWEELVARRPHDRPPGTYSNQGGVMIYTSGTTGNPKGATRVLKDTGLEAVGDFMLQVGVDARERHLIVCPMYHSGAGAFFAMVFSLGGTNVMLDHFDPEAALAAIERERITSVFLVPTMLARLAALDPLVRRRYDTSSLRWVCSGAAPLPTETARRFQAAFGPILWNFYGATEIGMVSLAGPADHAARPGTVGRILRGNEVRILDDAGAPVAPGEVGELYARNAMLIGGYHADPDATRRAMRDGFFSVGDLARLDADGYLYMESRRSDMVISGGVNIYPREIEDLLVTHPDIVECAVIGVPDGEWGESLKAYVVTRLGAQLQADEVVTYCQESLANYKRPRYVEFLDALPRNPTGKVLKRELRRLHDEA